MAPPTKPKSPIQVHGKTNSLIQPGVRAQISTFVIKISECSSYPYEPLPSQTPGKGYIQYLSWKGQGPPPSDVGYPGDVYFNGAKPCSLWFRTDKAWKEWSAPTTAPRLATDLFTHPHLPKADRYAWPEFDRLKYYTMAYITKSYNTGDPWPAQATLNHVPTGAAAKKRQRVEGKPAVEERSNRVGQGSGAVHGDSTVDESESEEEEEEEEEEYSSEEEPPKKIARTQQSKTPSGSRNEEDHHIMNLLSKANQLEAKAAEAEHEVDDLEGELEDLQSQMAIIQGKMSGCRERANDARGKASAKRAKVEKYIKARVIK